VAAIEVNQVETAARGDLGQRGFHLIGRVVEHAQGPASQHAAHDFPQAIAPEQRHQHDFPKEIEIAGGRLRKTGLNETHISDVGMERQGACEIVFADSGTRQQWQA
jgi:hypothetical protein